MQNINKKGDPGEEMSGDGKIPVLMKASHTSLSASSSPVHSGRDQADRWSCASAVAAAGMAATEGLHT